MNVKAKVIHHPRFAARATRAERHIVTEYRLTRHHVLRTNRAAWAGSAILRALHHMQRDHYAAKFAEVRDERTGLVLCVLTWEARRRLRVDYTGEGLRTMREGVL